MKIDLSNKVAFVTGSSSGIGQAMAVELGKAGAKVAIHYRGNREGAEQTARALSEADAPPTLIVQADASKEDELAQCFAAIDSELGPLDIFVNNAGIDGHKENLAGSSLETFERVIDVNLKGGYFGMRQALKRMLPRQSGVILSVTSVHEVVPWAGQAPYCASKAGIAMMTRCLALELQDSGIRVLNLAPGAIKTDINRDVWEDEEMHADLLTKIPQGRMGTTGEIARLATVLVSDAASYVHGTTVMADGAMAAYPSFAKGG